MGVLIDGGGEDTFTDLVGGLAQATAFAPQYPGPGGNFCFAVLLGAEQDRLPQSVLGKTAGKVVLRPVAMGTEVTGRSYPHGIGAVILESTPMQAPERK
jgi:hypothetical protein